MSGGAAASVVEEPLDDVVKKEILSTVHCMPEGVNYMRPNKIRKTICKKISRTNWTQFQRVLESAIEDKSIKTEFITEKEVKVMVILSSNNNSSSNNNGQEGVLALSLSPAPTAATKKKNKTVLSTQDLEIPMEVYYHLYRKGQKKKKNIELNTKTSLQCNKNKNVDSRKTLLQNGHPASDDVSDDKPTARTTTLTITKFWDDENKKKTDDADDGDVEDAKKVAQKQFESAIYMMKNMVDSFHKNPHHFAIQKAGGTFAEQDETKKRKAAAAKKKQTKHNAPLTKEKRSRKYY